MSCQLGTRSAGKGGRSQQTGPCGHRGCFEFRVRTELVQDVLHVRAHREHADVELIRNVAVRLAYREVTKYLELARSQATARVVDGPRLAAGKGTNNACQ